MNHSELDSVLSRTEEIVPSSGFTSAVMDAVRQEAAMPPPIPFPWHRAIPGLIACLGLVVFLFRKIWHFPALAPSAVSPSFSTAQVLRMVTTDLQKGTAFLSLEWFVAALLITLVALWISMRFAD